MHIAHARGVTIGDSLANLFRRIGWNVEKEFYINDAGNQIRSSWGVSLCEVYATLRI